METIETKVDLEAVNSTNEKIKYFLHLPAHIKGAVAALDSVNFKESIYDDSGKPAHVVGGSITPINGRINIPDIHKITRLYEINELPLLLLTNP